MNFLEPSRPIVEISSQMPPNSSVLGSSLMATLLAMLMGGASIVALGSAHHEIDPIWFKVRYGLVGIPLLGFMATAFFAPNPSAQRQIPPLLWVWLTFGSVALLSGLVNENIKGFSDGAWFLVAIPSLFFWAIPRAIGCSAGSVIAWGLVLGHLPYGILSVVQSPPAIFPYTGIFGNSNQLGVTMLTLNCGLFLLLNTTLLGPSTSAKQLKLGILGGAILVCFFLILCSNSRTSLFGSLLGVGLALHPLFPKIQHPKFVARLLLFFLGIIGVGLLYLGPLLSTLLKGVESGYTNKLGASDALNGRGPIWQKTFEDMRLFGYGDNEYFIQNFALGGHNSFIDILGQNGLIAFYLIIIIALMGLFSAYQYFRSQNGVNAYAIAPLLIGIVFWTVAMAESMFGSLGRGLTVAYLLSLGILLYRPNQKQAS